MSKEHSNLPQVAPPAATGNAGPQFEAKVGAFYLLSLLSGSEPRGLAGATARTVAFQRYGSDRPLDDVIVTALNADGTPAVLEIQAKRTLDFTASDGEFADVVARVWAAAQKPEFAGSRYELAVAISRTTTRIERSCQEALHWARHLPDGASFASHIAREGFSSKGMRDFVAVFRNFLADADAPTDDETVWRLLRRFQILVFDFEAPGSDFEHRARERARMVLAPEDLHRATDLWPVLVGHAGALATAGGEIAHTGLAEQLRAVHGFKVDRRIDLRQVDNRLSETARHTIDSIKDQVGGVRLARTELIEQARAALESARLVKVVAAPGVGKSAVLKHLAQLVEPEGAIIMLAPGRIVSGGWMQMSHALGCPVTRDELFNELGCGGGATLFVDNVDQIDDPGDWATVVDLMSGVGKNPGWRMVVTARLGNEEWTAKLPDDLKTAPAATVQVGEISDAESALLSEQNPALGILLSSAHPARGLARNLFYLSRMAELGDQSPLTAEIARETDLAGLWWRYGGGRAEDDGKWARLKVLREIAAQVLSHSDRAAFNADNLDPSTVATLLRFDSLREEIKGSTVAFRHDVLRDWSVAFLIHEQPDRLAALAMDRPISGGISRGLEIAARLELEADPTGARWLALLAAVEKAGCHGSWKRPVLLALPRSERAIELFERLQDFLLRDGGRRLGEIVRLLMAVDSEPLAKRIARVQPQLQTPAGLDSIVIPKGLSWMWLVVWIAARADLIPTPLIPDLSKLFQSWLIATQAQDFAANGRVVGMVFDWLSLVEDHMRPRTIRRIEDAPPRLDIPHLSDVRDELRRTLLMFAHLNPPLAERYLAGLDANTVRHYEMQEILKSPGNLARAAPTALTDFAIRSLMPEEDPDDPYRSRHDRFGPFGINDHLFSPASPGQGPFFELLEHAPTEGLRLVRAVVEHATQWRRSLYFEDRRPFPSLSLPFPEGARRFEGDFTTYHFSRDAASPIAGSALMALEAWGHRQIEAGRPFAEVLDDVLGADGSSVAFLSVAVDLALSHWPAGSDVVWPLVATPELLRFDHARKIRDMAGVDRSLTADPEAEVWRAMRADLDARRSRQRELSDTLHYYVFGAGQLHLAKLAAALTDARDRVARDGQGDEDPINGLRATAERAVRMTRTENWASKKVPMADGSEVEVQQYQHDEVLESRIATERDRAHANLRQNNVRAMVETALLDRSKSLPEIVAEAVSWAKDQPQDGVQSSEDEQSDFDKQWTRRAVVMAAALAARDYEGADRVNLMEWAEPLLLRTARERTADYFGNSQIQYNATAIATLGLVNLYMRTGDAVVRSELLSLAAHKHLAVINALGWDLPELSRADGRLPRALVRIVAASAIHSRRSGSDEQDRINRENDQARVETAIAEELRWFDGAAEEPAWPELPPWLSRPRRGIRLGGWTAAEEDEEDVPLPDLFLDEHQFGAVIGQLVRLTPGDLQAWLVSLAEHLMPWTAEANGIGGEEARDRDNRPTTWNHEFFDFLGVLCVALPNDKVVETFLRPMSQLTNEAFFDVAATFLRGFDRATIATDTRTPENPVAVRAFVSERLRRGWAFARLARERSFSTESHFGDALTAMFYQPWRLQNRGRPHIPVRWSGLPAAMPTLTDLVHDAPRSGYLAILFLNLVESSTTAPLLSFVVQAMAAWCAEYGVDPNFWSEREIGPRICAWLERMLDEDTAATRAIAGLMERLAACLDVLVRSGVAQASALEGRISEAPEPEAA